MLPPDLQHLLMSYQNIKWKRSIGSHISAVMLTHRATVHTPEILRGVGLALSIMSQLDHVWKQSRLSTTTKFRIYYSCVLSSLLCASESWTLLKADIAKLEAFHMTNQRRILGILWYEFVTNVEVATFSQLPSINEAISWRRHSLWPRQACGSGCSCTPNPTSLGHVTTGLRTVWHLAETTNTCAKMLGGADHHEHRALSFWCLECCGGSDRYTYIYTPCSKKRPTLSFAVTSMCLYQNGKHLAHKKKKVRTIKRT